MPFWTSNSQKAGDVLSAGHWMSAACRPDIMRHSSGPGYIVNITTVTAAAPSKSTICPEDSHTDCFPSYCILDKICSLTSFNSEIKEQRTN